MNRTHKHVPPSNRNKRKSGLTRAVEVMANTSSAGGIKQFFKPAPKPAMEEPQPKRRMLSSTTSAPEMFEKLVQESCADVVSPASEYEMSALWSATDFHQDMAQELAGCVMSKWTGSSEWKLIYEQEDRTGNVYLHLQHRVFEDDGLTSADTSFDTTITEDSFAEDVADSEVEDAADSEQAALSSCLQSVRNIGSR